MTRNLFPMNGITSLLLATALFGFDVNAMEKEEDNPPQSSSVNLKRQKRKKLNDENLFYYSNFKDYQVGIYDLKARAQVRTNDLLIDYYASISSETGYYAKALNYLHDWGVYSGSLQCQIRKDVLLQMIWAVVKDESDQYNMTRSDVGTITQGWHMTTIWGPKPEAIIKKFKEKNPTLKKIIFTYPEWMKGVSFQEDKEFDKELEQLSISCKFELGYYYYTKKTIN